MRLPETQELDLLAQTISGKPDMTFEQLGPEARIEIVKLAVSAEISESLFNLSIDSDKIGSWFEKSRLFDGIN